MARAAIVGVRLLVVPIDPVGDCGLDPTDDMPPRTRPRLIAFLDRGARMSASFSAGLPRQALVTPEFPGWELLGGATCYAA